MSSISNRFYITALEDGTTLHGNLTADQSLSQAWTGNGCAPDWSMAITTATTVNGVPTRTGTALQPVIHLTLLSGATTVGGTSIGSQTWYYNDTAIAFLSTEEAITIPATSTTVNGYWSTSDGTNPDFRFFKYKQVNANDVPTLRICSNLASSSNVDIDTIKFTGVYNVNGSSIDFSATIQVRITEIAANGFLGLINFVNGISDITEARQQLTLYGVLYSATGQADSNVKTKWYLNDTAYPNDPSTANQGTNIQVGTTTYPNAIHVEEADVVDHAIVKCEFYSDNTFTTLLYTAYAAIDDMQDPEFMYIQYSASGNSGSYQNANAASLRKDERAYFSIWVGRRDNPAVITDNGQAPGSGGTAIYNLIQIQFLDGTGTVITGAVSGLPDDQGSGWRNATMSSGVGTIDIPYDVVNEHGKSITGIVKATHVTT